MSMIGHQEIEFYREHGWWVSPVIIDEKSIDDLKYGAERYYAGERDRPLLVGLHNDWTTLKGNILRQNDYISIQMDEFREFLLTSCIAEVACRLAATPSVRLFHDQLIFKPPQIPERHNVVGWHTDKAYWKACTSENMITAWIPLQDTNEENGTLCGIDKSHNWDHHGLSKSFHTQDMALLEKEFQKYHDGYTVIPLNLKKGQVSFHHCRLVHGSQANSGTSARLAYAVHLQDHYNKYQKSFDSSGNHIIHTNDILCRTDGNGAPDYSDPDVCPTLWEC